MVVLERLYPWLLRAGARRYNRLTHDRKRALFGDLRGHVLEVGAGIGANFFYFPRNIRLTVAEPNPRMRPFLLPRAHACGLAPRLLECPVERLPLEDQCVDCVVGSLLLCSVNDVAAALAEIQRVLRPGGRYLFIEHVAAPAGTLRRRAQRAARPLWRWCGAGCQPDRESWKALENARFQALRLERFELPLGIVAPHIAGEAIK